MSFLLIAASTIAALVIASIALKLVSRVVKVMREGVAMILTCSAAVGAMFPYEILPAIMA